MIGALASPKVITWEDMVPAATNYPDYFKVAEIVLDSGKGPWPAGTKGIRKQREHLSVIDSVVIFRGQSVVPMSLRQQVLNSLHSGHQGITSMGLRAKDSVWWPGMFEDLSKVRERCRECITDTPTHTAKYTPRTSP